MFFEVFLVLFNNYKVFYNFYVFLRFDYVFNVFYSRVFKLFADNIKKENKED